MSSTNDKTYNDISTPNEELEDGALLISDEKDLTFDIDSFLVRMAQRGDIEAFDALAVKYEKRVYNISCRLLSDRDEAEDASQEVFLKVFRSIKDFKSESKFSTWIYRVTTNVCLDILRKRKDKISFSIDAEIEQGDGDVRFNPADNSPGVEDEIERSELKRLVSEAVKELPEIHRAIITLRDYQDLSYSEIAVAMDCPEGTIKSRISRARKALRDILVRKRELKGYISV